MNHAHSRSAEGNPPKVWIFISLLVLVNSLIFISFTVDDAWITYRYGYNLVEYGTWNFHPSPERRVEAYTNALYAFLSIIPHFFSIPVTWFFKAISIIIFILFIYFSQIERRIPILPFLFIATCPIFFIHLFSGLETPVFMLLIFIIAVKGKDIFASPGLCFTVALLFPLIRPEGALYSTTLGLWSLSSGNKKAFIYIFIAGAVYAVYFTIRLAFFDSLFPNPFYVKTANNYDIEFRQALKTSTLYWLLPLVLIAVLHMREIALWLAISLGVWVFIYQPSDLQMNYADRFLFQIFIPILLAIFSRISFQKIKQNQKKILVTAIISISFCAWIWKTYQTRNELEFIAKYSSSSLLSHKLLAEQLDTIGNLKILMGDAGIFSYHSKNNIVLDMIGLAHKEIAKVEISIELLAKEKPDIIFLYSTKRTLESIANVYNQSVVQEYMKQEGNYSQVSYVRCLDGNFLVSFVRNGHPNTNKIEQILINHSQKNDSYKFEFSKLLRLEYL